MYDEQFHTAVAELGAQIDGAVALAIWDEALASSWRSSPVWVHGDLALGNLLMRNGRLAAVIDFGQVCVGDPACDLAIAWTFIRAPYRSRFRARLELDSATWRRGKAWALWKAAIVTSGLISTNAAEGLASQEIVNEILRDHAQTEA